jgi:hypothetical protein
MTKAKSRCKIWFVIGGKGGTGKSFVISIVYQFLFAIGVVVELFDCDDETSTSSRFFPKTAKFLSIRSGTDLDQIVQLAVEGTQSVVLVDLPARAGDEFQAWFDVIPWKELAALGVSFGAIGIVSGSKDSLESVLRWREFLSDRVDYILALNRRDNLDIYFRSRAREEFISAGIPELEIPQLEAHLATELDRVSWTITHALECSEPHFLTQLMSKARLRHYRDRVFEELNKIKPCLVP